MGVKVYPVLIIYSHFEYSDTWPLLFGQTDLYLKDFKKILLSNKFENKVPDTYIKISYDDSLGYNKRVSSCLAQVEDSVVLFLHEDMVLMGAPNYNKIQEFVNLIETEKADFIKLIKFGDSFVYTDLHENLVVCPENSLFSIQPTITSRKKIFDIYDKTPSLNGWVFEDRVSNSCRNLNYNKCYMSFDPSEKKRGYAHWDSKIYPYIATAIVKGKWNYHEYEKELEDLLPKYGIDKNLRGIFRM